MKLAVPPVIRKLFAMPPKTMPVGPPGTCTTVLFTAPLAGIDRDVSVPSFAGHHGDVALLTSPHGLMRFGSKRSAGMLATARHDVVNQIAIARGDRC